MSDIVSVENKEDYILEYLFEGYKEDTLSILEYKIALELIGKQMTSELESLTKEKVRRRKWDAICIYKN